METKSAAIQLLELIYRDSCGCGGQSWAVVNAAMKSGIYLAVQARFQFEKEDFEYLSQIAAGHRYGRLGFWRWIGKDTEHWYGESVYKSAIDSGNVSACKSIEAWMKRKPFIVAGKRLGVGSTFYKQDDGWWSANSFSKDGAKINISRDNLRKALTAKELKAFLGLVGVS